MEARPVPGNRKKEHVRKVLFENAMQGKWKAVVNMYRRWPWLGKEKINRGGNTALHMAVSDRQERFVEQLVEVILLRSGMPELGCSTNKKQAREYPSPFGSITRKCFNVQMHPFLASRPGRCSQ